MHGLGHGVSVAIWTAALPCIGLAACTGGSASNAPPRDPTVARVAQTPPRDPAARLASPGEPASVEPRPSTASSAGDSGTPDSGIRVITTRWRRGPGQVMGRDAEGNTIISHAGGSSITIGFMFFDFSHDPLTGEAYLMDPQRRLVHFRLVETSPTARFESVGVTSIGSIENPERRAMLERLLKGPVPTAKEFADNAAGLVAPQQQVGPHEIHVFQPP
jgi:hypothetical protein